MKRLMLILFSSFLLMELLCRLGVETYIVNQVSVQNEQMFRFVLYANKKDKHLDLAQEAHPFFGTYWKSPHVNTVSYVEDFEAKNVFSVENQNKYFDIGVMGGSVAWYFAKMLGSDDGLRGQIAFLLATGKEIRIINFAIPAGKQPRQLAISTVYGSFLDLVISIDGVNEVVQLGLNSRPYYYPELLISAQFYPKTNREKIISIASDLVAGVRNLFRSLAMKIPSSLVRTMDPIADKIANRFLNGLNGLRDNYVDPNFSQSTAFQSWLSFHQIQRLIFEKSKVPFYSFFQPVPYFEKGKKLTINEKKLVLEQRQFDPTSFIHEDLLDKIHNSFSNGDWKQPISLLKVFNDSEDDIYLDGFCHVNDLGNMFMLKSILDSILADRKK